MYRVTIRKEPRTTWARDDNGHWRAHCDTEGSPPHGRELAEWIFHREEIGSVRVEGDATIVEILEGDECKKGE